MFTSHLTRSVSVTVAMGALGALVAVTPARGFDQSAWLEEQLTISDGTGYGRFVTGPDGGKPYRMDAQSVWLQGQLAISDGSAVFDRRDGATVDAGASRTATASVK